MTQPMFGGLLRRFLRNLGWLPGQQTRKPISRKTPRKSYHKERYDFSDGASALQIVASEIQRGDIQPAPQIVEGPDFGSWSAPA